MILHLSQVHHREPADVFSSLSLTISRPFRTKQGGGWHCVNGRSAEMNINNKPWSCNDKEKNTNKKSMIHEHKTVSFRKTPCHLHWARYFADLCIFCYRDHLNYLRLCCNKENYYFCWFVEISIRIILNCSYLPNSAFPQLCEMIQISLLC